MKYSFKCVLDGAPLSTEAKNDQEALTKLVDIAKTHLRESHKGQPAMPDKDLRKLIKSIWKKG